MGFGYTWFIKYSYKLGQCYTHTPQRGALCRFIFGLFSLLNLLNAILVYTSYATLHMRFDYTRLTKHFYELGKRHTHTLTLHLPSVFSTSVEITSVEAAVLYAISSNFSFSHFSILYLIFCSVARIHYPYFISFWILPTKKDWKIITFNPLITWSVNGREDPMTDQALPH